MFSCAVKPIALVLTSLDRICKPEVEIWATWRQFNVATAQFSGTLDPLSHASTPSDYGEHRQVQTEIETVPQTGSTNNCATETDIDAISMAMFLGVSFSTGLYANLTRRFLHAEVQDGGRIPEVVIIW